MDTRNFDNEKTRDCTGMEAVHKLLGMVEDTDIEKLLKEYGVI